MRHYGIEDRSSDHVCVFGQFEHSRIAGTLHRKCIADPACRVVSLDEDEEEDDEKTYKIVRCRFQGENETLVRGLTLEQAQAHCSREDTHGDGWFDAYYEEV